MRISDSVSKKMGIPKEKVPINLDRFGNTSSASIPLLLDEYHKKGIFKKDQLILTVGFGAGLTWGANLIKWNL